MVEVEGQQLMDELLEKYVGERGVREEAWMGSVLTMVPAILSTRKPPRNATMCSWFTALAMVLIGGDIY